MKLFNKDNLPSSEAIRYAEEQTKIYKQQVIKATNEYIQLQSNWNSLREWLEDGKDYRMYLFEVLDKMNELEGRIIMELWIRSQDKNVLENVKGFCIIHSSETCWNILNVDTTTRYGTYKTKERALEVLDEIQNLLKPPIIFQEHEGVITTNNNSLHIINPTYGEIKRLKTIVYEMPMN